MEPCAVSPSWASNATVLPYAHLHAIRQAAKYFDLEQHVIIVYEPANDKDAPAGASGSYKRSSGTYCGKADKPMAAVKR